MHDKRLDGALKWIQEGYSQYTQCWIEETNSPTGLYRRWYLLNVWWFIGNRKIHVIILYFVAKVVVIFWFVTRHMNIRIRKRSVRNFNSCFSYISCWVLHPFPLLSSVGGGICCLHFVKLGGFGRRTDGVSGPYDPKECAHAAAPRTPRLPSRRWPGSAGTPPNDAARRVTLAVRSSLASPQGPPVLASFCS